MIRLRSYCLDFNDLDPASGNQIARIFESFTQIFYSSMSIYLHAWAFYLARYFIARKKFAMKKNFKKFSCLDRAMVLWIYVAIIFEGVSQAIRFLFKAIVYFPITQRDVPEFEA